MQYHKSRSISWIAKALIVSGTTFKQIPSKSSVDYCSNSLQLVNQSSRLQAINCSHLSFTSWMSKRNPRRLDYKLLNSTGQSSKMLLKSRLQTKSRLSTKPRLTTTTTRLSQSILEDELDPNSIGQDGYHRQEAKRYIFIKTLIQQNRNWKSHS